MKKVQILLSTYNGERYLAKQLDSIINQDYREISIMIRDDGSTDNTIKIINEFILMDNRITYYMGKNIGVRNSFFDLMIKADDTADYYALSDQDDVWLTDKISKAVQKLEMINTVPALYCSDTTLVNHEMKPIVSNIKKVDKNPSFGNALVENINTGCTCVFNRELMKLVHIQIPEYTIMHDWWLYLIATAFGRVFYDNTSSILYRQHDDNIVGAKATYYDEFTKRLNNYKGNRGQIRRQLNEFHKLYHLNPDHERLYRNVIQAKKRIRKRITILCSNQIYRQRRVDNVIFKIMFLFGQI